MKTNIWIYLALGAAGVYVFQKYREGEPVISGSNDRIVESVMPWLGINNPIADHLVRKAATGFMNGFMGSEPEGEAIDVDFRRV